MSNHYAALISLSQWERSACVRPLLISIIPHFPNMHLYLGRNLGRDISFFGSPVFSGMNTEFLGV
jgi:hypothetical protein